MVTYVLDASAVLRYLDDEAGAQRVAEIIKSHLAGNCEVVISALHWGEIAGVVHKVHGRDAMDLALSRLNTFGFQIVAVNDERAVRASLIKLKKNIPYVDSFGVELASALPDSVLVTADFDLKSAQREIKIEFLPVK
jgi:predicted nucleic acid-binding protein